MIDILLMHSLNGIDHLLKEEPTHFITEILLVEVLYAVFTKFHLQERPKAFLSKLVYVVSIDFETMHGCDIIVLDFVESHDVFVEFQEILTFFKDFNREPVFIKILTKMDIR